MYTRTEQFSTMSKTHTIQSATKDHNITKCDIILDEQKTDWLKTKRKTVRNFLTNRDHSWISTIFVYS